MNDDATIVALATSALPSARMIVRTSGPRAFNLAAELGARQLAAGRATDVRLEFARLRTRAICYAFPAPRSHTGEDVVEYHLPGNPLLARLLVEALVSLGARQAQPGEFSARAFFNGKLRLDEAEGVAALISASNDRELLAAQRLRAGELARRLEPAMEELAEVLALCELGIDFTEEDVVVLEARQAERRIAALIEELQSLLAQSPRLEQLSHPPRVALVGRPNAGKSTLLNALAGYRRAVSSEQPGTTRDALTAEVELAGGRVTLVDLAGTGAEATDALDAEGRRRAVDEAKRADVLVLLRDVTEDRPDPPLPREADLVVHTKMDLLEQAQSPIPRELRSVGEGERVRGRDRENVALGVSALRGEGLDELRRRLSEAAFGGHSGTEALALSARHREQIGLAISAMEDALSEVALPAGASVAHSLDDRVRRYDPELLALHLREALDALGAIIGTVSPDELLGRIFGRFCIGK